MTLGVPGFAQVTFFTNYSSSINGYERVQYTLSNKITPNSSGTLTTIQVRIGDYSGSRNGENFLLTVCPDNNGQPSANNCSSFSSPYFPNGTEQNFPATYSYFWFTFTGTFAVNNAQPFWVTMSSSTTGLYSQYTNGGGLANIASGPNAGSKTFTWLMALTGTGPSPTLSVTNSPQMYTGSPIAASVTCSSSGAVSNIKYNSSSTVPTNAGTYAVTADCAANGSYGAATAASAGNFVISAAATPTLSVTNSPQTFTGGPIPGSVTCSSGGAVSNVRYNGSSTAPTLVGTYVVTADCSANGNYVAVTGASAGNFVINAVPTPISRTSLLLLTGLLGLAGISVLSKSRVA